MFFNITHTEIRRSRTAFIAIFALFISIAKGQDTEVQDSVRSDTVKLELFEYYWTKPCLVPKAGINLQETGFVELGVQWHQIYVHPLGLASAGPYFTVDVTIDDGNVIAGPKLGYELTAGLIGVAGDFTYYTDFERTTLMFTPKAGLTLLGFADLLYGRNIPVSRDRFPMISKNRFSLVFALNPDYFNLRGASKKVKKKK